VSGSKYAEFRLIHINTSNGIVLVKFTSIYYEPLVYVYHQDFISIAEEFDCCNGKRVYNVVQLPAAVGIQPVMCLTKQNTAEFILQI